MLKSATSRWGVVSLHDRQPFSCGDSKLRSISTTLMISLCWSSPLGIIPFPLLRQQTLRPSSSSMHSAALSRVPTVFRLMRLWWCSPTPGASSQSFLNHSCIANSAPLPRRQQKETGSSFSCCDRCFDSSLGFLWIRWIFLSSKNQHPSCFAIFSGMLLLLPPPLLPVPMRSPTFYPGHSRSRASTLSTSPPASPRSTALKTAMTSWSNFSGQVGRQPFIHILERGLTVS